MAKGPKKDDPALMYYPDGLKRHYMDLLLRYKLQLAKDSGKRVGWQSLRDRIMEREDAEEAAEKRRQGYGGLKDRPRSPLVNAEDFKGWYKPGNSHLPTNEKFQFIDRFIRGLRLNGQLDEIERIASDNRREYHRESLANFYRLTGELKRNEEALAQIALMLNHTIFAAYCRQPLEDPSFELQYLLFMFAHEFKGHISPVEIVACRLPAWLAPKAIRAGSLVSSALGCLTIVDTLASPLVYLYSGFIVLESYALRSPEMTQGASASLILSNPSGAGVGQKMLSALSLPHENSRVFLFPASSFAQDADIPINGVIAWPEGGSNVFNEMGCQIIAKPGSTYWLDRPREDALAGFVQITERSPQFNSLRELKEKFAIGYRPC